MKGTLPLLACKRYKPEKKHAIERMMIFSAFSSGQHHMHAYIDNTKTHRYTGTRNHDRNELQLVCHTNTRKTQSFTNRSILQSAYDTNVCRSPCTINGVINYRGYLDMQLLIVYSSSRHRAITTVPPISTPSLVPLTSSKYCKIFSLAKNKMQTNGT